MAILPTNLRVISYNYSGGGETFPGRAGAHRHGDYPGPHQLSRSLANRSLPFLTPTNQRLHLYTANWKPLRARIPVYSSAGILEQPIGARNRVGIGLSYWPASLHMLTESNP
jgi:hypothetical protein